MRHGLILELWEKAGFQVKKSGSSWVSPNCPRCGRARTGHRVSLDPGRNLWKCFGEGCDAQGGLRDFCEEMGWDFQEVMKELGEEFPGRKKKREKKNSVRDSIEEREQLEDLPSILYPLPDEAKQYLEGRGIDPEVVEEYVFGINPKAHGYAKWLWEQGYRFFVPQYFKDGKILSGRFRLVGEGKVKSRSPKGKSNFLFREKIKDSDVLEEAIAIVLEGEIDFLSALTLVRKFPEKFARYVFYAVPGATYTLRDEEIESFPSEVVLFLDRGAEREAERLARQVYAHKKKVFIGRYPEPYKDLNEWLQAEGLEKTAEGLLKAIEQAWISGAYTPLKGISREVEGFLSEISQIVTERERLSEVEWRLLQKVFPTGIPQLDEILSGGFRPALYGIAGAPGAGKTSFLLSLLKHIIRENNAYVLFASLEMPLRQIIAYLLSWGARMSWMRILSMDVDRNGLERLKQAKKDLSWLFKSLHILQGSLSVKDIERELVELKNMSLDQGRPFFVAVDYLQMLRLGKGPDLRVGVTEAVRELAEIANRHEVPVLVISSTARGMVEEALKGKRSIKEVFKESGDIEYALFSGFLLVKDSEQEGGLRRNRLIVAKNRGGVELRGGNPVEFGFDFNIFTGEMI